MAMVSKRVVLRAGRDAVRTRGTVYYDQQHHILHTELSYDSATVRFLGSHYGQHISIEVHNMNDDLKAIK